MSVLVAAFALLGFTAVDAQAQTNPTQNAQQTQTAEQGQNKEKISPEDLPDAVKAAVVTDEYKEWQIGEVYKLKPAEDGEQVLYEVQFLKEGEQEPVLVRFDETGKKVTS